MTTIYADEVSGRSEAVLVLPGGATRHLGARERCRRPRTTRTPKGPTSTPRSSRCGRGASWPLVSLARLGGLFDRPRKEIQSMTKSHILLALAASICTIAVNAATPGSDEAATETAVSAASKALSMALAPAQVHGDEAIARVVVGGVQCTVQMQRDAKGPEGWLVTKLDCPSKK